MLKIILKTALFTFVSSLAVTALSATAAAHTSARPALDSVVIRRLERGPHPLGAEVLRAALMQSTLPQQQVELLQALTRLKDYQSVANVIPLMHADDLEVAMAAQRFLGLMATPEALRALLQLPYNATTAPALNSAAGQLRQQHQDAQARQIYLTLCQTQTIPAAQRLTSLAALLRLAPQYGPQLLPEHLASNEAEQRAYAGHLAALLPPRYLRQLSQSQLSIPQQASLLTGIRTLGAKAGLKLARRALQTPELQIIALQTLGAIGTAADFKDLFAQLQTESAAHRQAAQDSLTHLADTKLDPLLVHRLQVVHAPNTQRALLEIITARQIKAAAPMLPPFLQHPDESLRLVALQALTGLAGVSEIPATVQHAHALASDAETRAYAKTLLRLARDFPEAITEAIEHADTPELIQALAHASIPAGLPLLTAQFPDEHTLRTVANYWKTALAIEPLLQQAQEHPKPSMRIVALQGVIRLLPQVEDATHYAALWQQAQSRATRPQEREALQALTPPAPAN